MIGYTMSIQPVTTQRAWTRAANSLSVHQQHAQGVSPLILSRGWPYHTMGLDPGSPTKVSHKRIHKGSGSL
eukprot:12143851-Karenia_brevis.AAC.1